jgi:hypothetical protein
VDSRQDRPGDSGIPRNRRPPRSLTPSSRASRQRITERSLGIGILLLNALLCSIHKCQSWGSAGAFRSHLRDTFVRPGKATMSILEQTSLGRESTMVTRGRKLCGTSKSPVLCSTWDWPMPRDWEGCRELAPALLWLGSETASYDRDCRNQNLRSMGIELNGIDDPTQKRLALRR